MKIKPSCKLLVLLVLLGSAATAVADFSTFPVNTKTYKALECRPDGPGPFPAVVYNHGSIVDARGVAGARAAGNKLDEICHQLAKDGFLAFFPIRSELGNGRGYREYRPEFNVIVNAAIDHVKSQNYVEPSKISLMGHSMGGLITLLVAEKRKDLRSIVVSAPASKNQYFGSAISYANEITIPVLLMVEQSDAMHVKGVSDLEAAFKKHNNKSTVIRYKRGGGHNLFFTVDYYWPDVIKFLRANN